MAIHQTLANLFIFFLLGALGGLGACGLVSKFLFGTSSSSTCSGTNGTCPSLTMDTVPRRIIDAEYAVRGEIVTRSFDIDKKLKQKDHGLPFDETVPCNIGNPQAVGAKPITFHRQVISLLSNTQLLDDPNIKNTYPPDVIKRAKTYRDGYKEVGAYSHSKGIALFREEVAKYMNRRDGPKVPPIDIEDIFLTDGASAGVKTVLEVMINDEKDGILIPTPQYPLYSASITRLGGTSIGYELTEDYNSGKGWGVDINVIEAQIKKYQAKGGRVRGIAVINPGNPTGNVMTREDIKAVVELCHKYNLVILADEVYQDNIFRDDRQFISFREVVLETKLPVELFSFHSMSKGYYGECGLRGGVLTLTNIDQDVADQIYKLFSMILCANTLGQALMASILNPPQKGDASYKLFNEEREGILKELKRKAELVTKELNSIEGMATLPVEGAMYSFPQVFLPRKFIEEANALGKAPDLLYCIKMMESTGVITVPGSGFGQRPNTWHFRMTILPEYNKLKKVLERMKNFNAAFLKQYLSPDEKVAML
eukprot:TRINITY_DN17953_c0_g1_i1.p1 TRINITY_DN17953_c0_g1~~TRINITY_DN17953_c0_g1_i1.p1  ORF type:complete len:539 (-),score=122.36 TRINITY_DN17953_c0_g1_i1:109-1725(-)